jgi:hypothetical protein
LTQEHKQRFGFGVATQNVEHIVVASTQSTSKIDLMFFISRCIHFMNTKNRHEKKELWGNKR